MYRTGIITDEVSQDLRVAAKLAKDYGLDSLEIRSVKEKNPFQMERRDFIDIKKIADEFGLEICCIGSPFFKCNIDDASDIQRHLDLLKRSVEVCQLWNTKLIRGFTFWKEPGKIVELERIAELFCPAADIMKDGEITLVLESEPACWVCDIPGQVEILKMIDSPYVAALYDPGNEIVSGGKIPPYPDGYNMLKEYIKHVHLKDMKASENGYDPALLGQGDVDFYGIIDSLKRDGYDGYVSVETHFRIKERMNEDLLQRPQGSSFSEGGYEASVKYLDILRDEYKWMER